MFHWVLNMSLIIQRLFLLLLIDDSTLSYSWIFLIWLVFYLSIYNRSFPVRCDKVLFETCQNSIPWRTKKYFLISSGFLIDNLEHVHNWIGCYYWWKWSNKRSWERLWECKISVTSVWMYCKNFTIKSTKYKVCNITFS